MSEAHSSSGLLFCALARAAPPRLSDPDDVGEDPSGAQSHYRLGDRVRLSQLGKQRSRRPTAETGTVVGLVNPHNTSIRVLFDGLKTAKSLHRKYIEPLDDNASKQEDGSGSSSN
jgi:hypothetical protein